MVRPDNKMDFRVKEEALIHHFDASLWAYREAKRHNMDKVMELAQQTMRYALEALEDLRSNHPARLRR